MLRMMKWGLGAIGVGVAGLIAVTALGLGGASAQTPSPADGDGPGRYAELLAEELGISVEELNEARLNARNAAIDEAVDAGKLTEEQGEEMKSRELGEGIRKHFGDRPGGKLMKAVINVFQSAAESSACPSRNCVNASLAARASSKSRRAKASARPTSRRPGRKADCGRQRRGRQREHDPGACRQGAREHRRDGRARNRPRRWRPGWPFPGDATHGSEEPELTSTRLTSRSLQRCTARPLQASALVHGWT